MDNGLMSDPEKCCENGARITVPLTLYLKFYVSGGMHVFFTPLCHYDTRVHFQPPARGYDNDNYKPAAASTG